MNSPMIYYDAETGVSKYVITAQDGSIHVGSAMCRDEDRDMQSEITGCRIAEYRAYIDYLKHMRDNHIRPELESLKKFYYSINQSSKYNKNDYVCRMLDKAIDRKEQEYYLVRKEIENQRYELNNYMKLKEEIYTRLRKKRTAKNT